MEFRKAKPVSLKAHETFNEKWLQNLLARSVLGQHLREPDRLGLSAT